MSRHERRKAKAPGGVLLVDGARQGGGYVERYRKAIASGAIDTRPGVFHLVVEHDAWCTIYQGQRCNCDPIMHHHDGNAVVEIDHDGNCRRSAKS